MDSYKPLHVPNGPVSGQNGSHLVSYMSLICLNGPFKGLHGPFKILIGNLGVFVGKPACKGYSGDPAGHH